MHRDDLYTGEDVSGRFRAAGLPPRAFEVSSAARVRGMFDRPGAGVEASTASAAAVAASSPLTLSVVAAVGGAIEATADGVGAAAAQLAEHGPSAAAAVYEHGRSLFGAFAAGAGARERRRTRVSLASSRAGLG
mmetsp:Transcript_20929/g.59190  ORF Transcript_20929/g.59190 Transcript_20929/m.59190 type:complete len:134 (+) Transcript_20929:134-535(+)